MPGRFTSRTAWREKLEREDHSKIVQIPPRMTKMFGSGTMLIPRPIDVDALIRKAGKGRLITPSQIRARLARENNVDVTCPLTTGIFIRIAAETAEEDLRNGRKRITPYWRVVREDGTLMEKLPGGVKSQTQRLRAEGHVVEPGNGKKLPRVRDVEKRLVRLGGDE
jgi:hypothetical protein